MTKFQYQIFPLQNMKFLFIAVDGVINFRIFLRSSSQSVADIVFTSVHLKFNIKLLP